MSIDSHTHMIDSHFEGDPSGKERILRRVDIFASKTLDGVLAVIQRSHPQIAAKFDFLINNPDANIRNKVRKGIISMGQNSIETTAALFIAMLNGIERELGVLDEDSTIHEQELIEMIQSVLEGASIISGHHTFEVVSDSLDTGTKITSERVDFMRGFNVDAMRLCVGDTLDQINREDFLLNEDLEIVRIFQQVFGKDITIADLLIMNLSGVQGIIDRIKNTPSPCEELDEFILLSLQNRYQAVQEVIEKGFGYAVMNLNQAIETREDTILIKVTMGMLIREIAMKNPEIAEVLRRDIETIKECMSLAAKLIGLWNDLGSGFLRMEPSAIVELLQNLKLNEYLSREIIAPQAYLDLVRSIPNITTSDLTTLRASIDGTDKRNWDQLAQLLKDATFDEHSLVLDIDITPEKGTGTDRFMLILELAKRARYYEVLLGNKLLELHPVIATIIRNAAIFHAQLYKGGDYYGKVRSGVEQPIVFGIPLADDEALMCGGVVPEL